MDAGNGKVRSVKHEGASREAVETAKRKRSLLGSRAAQQELT